MILASSATAFSSPPVDAPVSRRAGAGANDESAGWIPVPRLAPGQPLPPLEAVRGSASTRGLPFSVMPGQLIHDAGGATLRSAPAVIEALGVDRLDPNQLAVSATQASPRLTYVHLRQTRGGLPVLGSRLTFQWRTDGALGRVSGSWIDGSPRASRSPTLDRARAEALALDAFAPGAAPEWLLAEEAWAPLAGEDGIDWRRVWRFHVVVEEGFFEIWIDADTGAHLAIEPLSAFEEITGSVAGAIEPRTVGDVQETVPFRNARVSLRGDDSLRTAHADPDGAFSFSDLPAATYSLRSELASPAIRVRDAANGLQIPIDSLSVSSGAVEIVWDDRNSRPALRNAFAHGTRVHRFIRELDAGEALAALDQGTELWVDDPALSCNAVWDGTRVKFYQASGGCRSTARIADVVYHEYGHAITYHLYRPFTPPRDMNEAFSDYLAATLTNDPRLGLGLFGTGTFLRELEANFVWPDDQNLDPHLQGLILAGALWDLRTRVGAEVCDPLFHFARYALASDFHDYLLDLLAYDDDDGDLFNGTPHFADIIGAFRPHGIGDYSVRITADPIPDVKELAGPIPVEARIHSLLGLDPDSLALFYRVAGETEFQRAPLHEEGGRRFVGAIAPPPPGSIVEYFWSAADTSGNRATLPAGAPDELASFSAGPDLVPPQLEHFPLSAVADGRALVRMEARVRDNTGLIASVAIDARDSSGRRWNIPMQPETEGSDRYVGDLPIEIPVGDTLWYSISAIDAASHPNVSTVPPEGEFAVAVRPGRFLSFDQDEGGLRGDGEWEWGFPGDIESSSPLWATRLEGKYANSAYSVLEWGPIDISGYTTALLEFDHLYEFVTNSDGGRVEASNDGRVWRVLLPAEGYPSASVTAFEGAAYTGSSQGWKRALFALDRVRGNQLWLRWVFASDPIATDFGWYIDDVNLLAAQARIAPHSVRATSGDDGQVPLSWSAPRGIDVAASTFLGYRIERAGPDEPFEFLTLTQETSHLDRGVANDVTYRYRVRAVYTEGDSPPVEVAATPAAPQMLFPVRSLSFTLRGVSAADTTFFVENLGLGTLHFDTYLGEPGWTIDDARIEFDIPAAGEPERIVSVDPVDAPGNPDLARIGVLRQTEPEGDLRFRLQGHSPWSDPNLAWGGVCFLDTDGNVGTRPESFGFGWNEDINIGWEYAVVFGSIAREFGAQTPALLYRADRPDQPIRLDRVDFPEEGREISFHVPLAALGNPERLQMSVILARSREGDPFERVPELPDVPWLKREPRHGRARLGQPSPLSFEFDARPVGSGEFSAQVFVTTNDPDDREFAIPIMLQVRDVIPGDLPFYRFAAEISGVRIEATLPTEPAAEGTLIERLDTRTRVWRTVSGSLPPDEEGKIVYLDASAEPGVEYEYRFRVRFLNGQIVVFGPYLFNFQLPLPRELELTAQGSNPFRGRIPLRLGLPGPVLARVAVFDVTGRKVRQLVNGPLPAGIHRLEWDGRAEDGTRTATGVYWVRADTGAESETIRVVHFP